MRDCLQTSSASRLFMTLRDISPSINRTRAGRRPRQCRKLAPLATAIPRASAASVLPNPVSATISVRLVVVNQ